MIILLNKPFNVLSQFRDGEGRDTLAKYIDIPNIYPAGRLDRDSEGLIVLTDDGKLQGKISHPKHKMEKCYWVQVEGIPNSDALQQLRDGVDIKGGRTAPATVKLIDTPSIWLRKPPIRERKNIPDSWIELRIREGKNRQIRRMSAAVGFPTLRLIRTSIGPWNIDGLKPGEWCRVNLDGDRL